MNVENISSNTFSFTAIFPDATTQGLTLAPSQSVQVYGATVGATTYQDSFDTNWVLVNDSTTGFQAHALITPTSEFILGFFDVAPLTAILACLWMIRRSLSTSSRGHTPD